MGHLAYLGEPHRLQPGSGLWQDLAHGIPARPLSRLPPRRQIMPTAILLLALLAAPAPAVASETPVFTAPTGAPAPIGTTMTVEAPSPAKAPAGPALLLDQESAARGTAPQEELTTVKRFEQWVDNKMRRINVFIAGGDDPDTKDIEENAFGFFQKIPI
ncbi:MAG: hypothetical protein CMJ87_12055, partial [Planctomycetes bacterium]|nr:hypothetical protein [Planctomycetota bacterium]